MHHRIVVGLAVLFGSAQQEMDVVAHQRECIDHHARKLEQDQGQGVNPIDIIFLIPEQQLLLQLLGIDLKARLHVLSFFFLLHPPPSFCKGLLITCVVSLCILSFSCYILSIFAFKGQRDNKMADILTETYQRIRLRLKARAGKVLADAEAAEDALQDAFLKLWGRYPVRNEQEAEALLTRTVRNVAIDQLRKRKTVPIAGDLPEEDGENRETRFRLVEEMVDTALTDIQKLIIRRHEYEGVHLEQIAKELGMQPPAVRMQLSRARKAIRKQYRKRYHEE